MALHENPDPCFNGFQLSSSVELRGNVNVEGFQNESKIRVVNASFPVNTGKLEGFNNKIKVAKRNAYGFRNLSFFLLYQIPFNSQNLFLNPQKNMKNRFYWYMHAIRRCISFGCFSAAFPQRHWMFRYSF